MSLNEGVKPFEERLWYANIVIQEGLFRNALMDSIGVFLGCQKAIQQMK